LLCLTSNPCAPLPRASLQHKPVPRAPLPRAVAISTRCRQCSLQAALATDHARRRPHSPQTSSPDRARCRPRLLLTALAALNRRSYLPQVATCKTRRHCPRYPRTRFTSFASIPFHNTFIMIVHAVHGRTSTASLPSPSTTCSPCDPVRCRTRAKFQLHIIPNPKSI